MTHEYNRKLRTTTRWKVISLKTRKGKQNGGKDVGLLRGDYECFITLSHKQTHAQEKANRGEISQEARHHRRKLTEARYA